VAKQIDIGSVAGIDRAIAYIQKQLSEEALQKKVDKAAKSLLTEAKSEAEQAYAGTSAIVTQRDSEGLHSLIAESPEIAFIEFGAGYGVVAAGEFADKAEFDVEPGSWSRLHDGPFARTGQWEHNGQTYTEIPAQPGMELARQYVEDHAEKKLKEVFGVD
jgi:hypothetical protein